MQIYPDLQKCLIQNDFSEDYKQAWMCVPDSLAVLAQEHMLLSGLVLKQILLSAGVGKKYHVGYGGSALLEWRYVLVW